MTDQLDMSWQHENVVSLTEHRDEKWQRRFDGLQNRAKAQGLEIVPACKMYGEDEPGWVCSLAGFEGSYVPTISQRYDAGVPGDLDLMEHLIACVERGE